MPRRPRVAIYARYSTDMQNPKSIDDQMRECRGHAAREGWDVIDTFSDEGVSGATVGRPGFIALQEAVDRQQVDIVLFEHVDRVSRDLEQLMRFYKAARFVDAELHQLHRGKLGIFDIGILGTFSQIFLEELGFKTHRGLKGKVEEGKQAGGIAYGYRRALSAAGAPVKGELVIDESEAAIVRRIFTEYAAGKSPRDIAADLNAEGIPSPRAGGKGSGHWKQNTIYGNRKRSTGILNNELYIGWYVWDRLAYSKHPTTGKRVSKLKPEDQRTRAERPHLRLMEDALWKAAKNRQDLIEGSRQSALKEGKTGAGAAQAARRRKYLLSGLLSCGHCGGNLTVAGKGERRRYYCANAKEKGPAVCEGMPGVKETDAAEAILGGLRNGLMQDEAYADFRERYVAKVRAQEAGSVDALRRHDDKIKEREKAAHNILKAIEGGTLSQTLVNRLDALEADLKELRAKRASLVPVPIELPKDLPALYRRYIDDLVGTLTSEEVAGPAADELHRLVESVIVSWDEGKKRHNLEVRGELVEMLAKLKPTGSAGLVANGCSLKLVAGVGFEPTTFRL